MRKFFTVALPIFIMIIVAIICVVMYLLFTDKLPKLRLGKNETTAPIEQPKDSIVLSRNELPSLDAAVTLQPMLTAIVRDFTQDEKISSSNFNFSDTEEGYKKLLSGEIDILLATYPSEDTLAMAKASGIELEVIPIAKEGFVFYVSSKNPIESLNISDIQKIYTGQVSNWAELGGENLEIKAIQRTRNSLNQMAMNSLVMKDLEIVDPPMDVFDDVKFGRIDDLIAGYDNSVNAIGYSYYYEAQSIYDTGSDSKVDNTIKFLRINEVAPNYANIYDGTYPIQTNYYLIRNKANNYENVQIFVDNILSDRGKNVIKEAGYIDN